MGAQSTKQDVKKQDNKARPNPVKQDPVPQAETTIHPEQEPLELLLQRAQQNPDSITPTDSSRIQRSIGNHAYNHLINKQPHPTSTKPARNNALHAIVSHASSLSRKPTIQSKLEVNEVNDAYEQEADTMADAVMRMPSKPSLTPPPNDPENNTPTVQRHIEDPGGNEATPDVESGVHNLQGKGSPLPDQDREFFESRMGANFSNVRVHTGSDAEGLSQDLNARAFTVGSDIAFNKGEYQPGSNEGRRLLAHELTHTIQQGAVSQKESTAQRKQSQIQRKVKTTAAAIEPEPPETVPDAPEKNAMPEAAAAEPAAVEATDGQQAQPTEESSQEQTAPENVAVEATAVEAADGQQAQPTEESSQEQTAPENAEQQQPTPEDEEKAAEAAQNVPELANVPETANEDKPQKGKAVSAKELVPEKGEESSQKPDAAQQNGRLAEGKKSVTEGLTALAAPVPVIPTSAEQATPASDSQGTLDTAKGRLNEAQNKAQDTASAPVVFAESEAGDSSTPVSRKPSEEQGGDGKRIVSEAEFAALASQSAGLISGLAGSISDKIAQLLALAAAAEAKLTPAMQAARQAIIDGELSSREAATQVIAESRARAEQQTSLTIDSLQTKYDTLVEGIGQSATDARKIVTDEYDAKIGNLDTLETTKPTEIEAAFTTHAGQIRTAGTTVGNEALALGNQKSAEFASYVNPSWAENSFLNGYDYHQRKQAAMQKAATEVSKAYSEEFITTGNDEAAKLEGAHGDVVTELTTKIAASRKTIEDEKSAAIAEIDQAEQMALTQAAQTYQQQLTAVQQSLKETNAALDQSETETLTQISKISQDQCLSLEDQANQSIAQLQSVTADSADQLSSSVNSFVQQANGIPAPDPDKLGPALSEAEGQINNVIAQIEGSLGSQTDTLGNTFTQQGAETATELNDIGLNAATEITPIDEAYTTGLTELLSNTDELFGNIKTDLETKTSERAGQAKTNIGNAYTDADKQVTEIMTCLNTGLGKYVKGFTEEPDGLRGSMSNLEATIDSEAQEAADKVKPAWVKILATIVISVIVAIAIAAIASVTIVSGGSALLLLGGLAGAMAVGVAGNLAKNTFNNWADGQDFGEAFMSSLTWQNVAIGALEGALTFATMGAFRALKLGQIGGEAGKSLLQSAGGMFAAEVAADTVKDTLVSSAQMWSDNTITFMRVLQSFGENLAINAITGGLMKAGEFAMGRMFGDAAPSSADVPSGWKETDSGLVVPSGQIVEPDIPTGYVKSEGGILIPEGAGSISTPDVPSGFSQTPSGILMPDAPGGFSQTPGGILMPDAPSGYVQTPGGIYVPEGTDMSTLIPMSGISASDLLETGTGKAVEQSTGATYDQLYDNSVGDQTDAEQEARQPQPEPDADQRQMADDAINWDGAWNWEDHNPEEEAKAP